MPLALLAEQQDNALRDEPGRAVSKFSCAGAQRGLNTAMTLKFESRMVAAIASPLVSNTT